MTLADNVDKLVHAHMAGHVGAKHPTRERALLDRLAEAIAPSAGGGATGSSSEARLPVAVAAIDLAMHIDREARTTQRTLGWPGGTVKDIIWSWASRPLPNEEWVKYLDQETRAWVGQIHRLLDPPKLYRPSAPCPHCGERFSGPDREPALSVRWADQRTGKALHPSQWRMTCAECGTAWVGNDLGVIAHAIATHARKTTQP